MLSVLYSLLSTDPIQPSFESLECWWAHHQSTLACFSTPVDAAIVGGFTADRLAYAFAAGYQAALRTLVPSLPAGVLASLCATEAGGVHPGAICTQLVRHRDGLYRLSGTKTWATCAPDARVLLVVGSGGQGEDGRNMLKCALVDASAPGVVLSPQPSPGFVPELPHASVRFDDVALAPSAVLEGDGYVAYLKPFRTVEDTHVLSSLLAHLLGIARRSRWPRGSVEQLAAAVATAHLLARESAHDPSGHIALAGLFAWVDSLVREAEPYWQNTDEPTRTRWARDRSVLAVANKARSQRLQSAWRALAAEGAYALRTNRWEH